MCLGQVRETKVRRAGIGGRARLAGELRDMDDEVRTIPHNSVKTWIHSATKLSKWSLSGTIRTTDYL